MLMRLFLTPKRKCTTTLQIMVATIGGAWQYHWDILQLTVKATLQNALAHYVFIKGIVELELWRMSVAMPYSITLELRERLTIYLKSVTTALPMMKNYIAIV